MSSPVSGPSGPFASATVNAIPDMESRLGPIEVVNQLEKRSQQGKLPGFQRSGPTAFGVRIYGAPYDRDLRVRVESAGSGSVLRSECRMRMRLPWIVGIVTALSIWPGVILTDSLMCTWFPSWYPKQIWVTYAWYMPLCLLAIPALWKQFKASEKAAEEHLRETLAKFAGWIGVGGEGSGGG